MWVEAVAVAPDNLEEAGEHLGQHLRAKPGTCTLEQSHCEHPQAGRAQAGEDTGTLRGSTLSWVCW